MTPITALSFRREVVHEESSRWGSAVQELSRQPDECPSLLTPRVRQVNLLPSLHDLDGLRWTEEYVFDFSRQVFRVTGLEENERVVVEIVLDAHRARRNHW